MTGVESAQEDRVFGTPADEPVRREQVGVGKVHRHPPLRDAEASREVEELEVKRLRPSILVAPFGRRSCHAGRGLNGTPAMIPLNVSGRIWPKGNHLRPCGGERYPSADAGSADDDLEASG